MSNANQSGVVYFPSLAVVPPATATGVQSPPQAQSLAGWMIVEDGGAMQKVGTEPIIFRWESFGRWRGRRRGMAVHPHRSPQEARSVPPEIRCTIRRCGCGNRLLPELAGLLQDPGMCRECNRGIGET